MANTYTQIHIHIVFAVKSRQSLISTKHRAELHKYITGIIQNRNQKLLAIFAMPDHVHVLVGMNSSVSIAELTRDIKAGSSKFINDNHWVVGKFSWQEGYGAFSYSKNQISIIINYILNQEQHHAQISFRDEYINLLKEFDIPYDEKYLFEWIE